MLFYLLPFAAVAILGGTALYALTGASRQAGPDTQADRIAKFAEAASLLALLVTAAACAVLLREGADTSPLLGLEGLGFSARVDAVSMIMLTLISFIGWVVLRYAATYMAGEARHRVFTGWLCATLASVMLLVVSGNLVQLVVAWVATSVCLHKLLLFYPERVAAQRAAAKKFVMARLGDVVLAAAAVCLWLQFGTGDIASIADTARASDATSALVIASTVLLAIAACLKSAQFPTHGWLTEVMETPTPVSALLHAGVINAGGFLLIRFADVMLLAPGVLAALVMVGGFTALFGGLVMLTQPAVKTSLAWSTVSQMGFMIMQCGLALFPIALLHIVAHSLYKAHAFLASGLAVERVAFNKRPGPIAIPSGAAVGRAFLIALAIYAAIAFLFGLENKSPQAIALGAILIFGVAYLIAQGLADAAPRVLTVKTSTYAIAASVAYFALQRLAEWMMGAALPAAPAPGPLEWTLISLSVLTFGAVALAQSMFPLWAHHPAAAGLRVHLSNGLYVNAITNRILGGWTVRNPS